MIRKKAILDTDFGTDPDDALALAFALASKEIDLIAITVCGRQSIYRASLVRKHLLAWNRDIPVYAGEDQPLRSPSRFNWKGHEGKVFDDNETATEAIIRILRDSENDTIEFIAIGMLTNLAKALSIDPLIASKIAKLTIMGGHLYPIPTSDNKNKQSLVLDAEEKGTFFPEGIDYNLCSDPDATLQVLLNKDIRNIVLVTADVTLQVWLNLSHIRILESINHPGIQLLIKETEAWTPHLKQFLKKHGTSGDDNVSFLHDPLTVACAFDDTFCTLENLLVEVSIVEPTHPSEGLRYVRTIPRREDEKTEVTRIIRCATKVDSQKFVNFFMDRLISNCK